jgi:hypothetical protein
MKLEELIDQFRFECQDEKAPYLWSETALIRWFNEAEQRACAAMPLLIDSQSSFTLLTAAVSDPWIKLDRRVITVLRARPVGKRSVDILSAKQMDCIERWEERTGKDVQGLIQGLQTYSLRVYPILDTSDIEIQLTVQRKPLNDMADGNDEPEIPSEHHLKLIPWVKYRAYSLDDVDANDPDKAKSGYAEFAAEFGLTSAQHQDFMRRHGNTDLMPGGFLA